jgi:hypothetical protein
MNDKTNGSDAMITDTPSISDMQETRAFIGVFGIAFKDQTLKNTYSEYINAFERLSYCIR